jgi:hypothetical protein
VTGSRNAVSAPCGTPGSTGADLVGALGQGRLDLDGLDEGRLSDEVTMVQHALNQRAGPSREAVDVNPRQIGRPAAIGVAVRNAKLQVHVLANPPRRQIAGLGGNDPHRRDRRSLLAAGGHAGDQQEHEESGGNQVERSQKDHRM